jgi:hypothetical protein
MGLVGYALIFKSSQKTLMALRTKREKTMQQVGSKSKVEWEYDEERSIYTRVEGDGSTFDDQDADSSFTSRTRTREGQKSSTFYPKGESRSSMSQLPEEVPEKSDDEQEINNETVFARIARQLNRDWDKNVIRFIHENRILGKELRQ